MRRITDSKYIELSVKDLFKKCGFDLSEDFKNVLMIKYLERLVLPKLKRPHKKKEQDDFLDFLLSDEEHQIDQITIKTAKRSYTCSTDSDVLSVFENMLEDIKKEFFESTYNDEGSLVETKQIRSFAKKEASHNFKPRVSRLKRSLEVYFKLNNIPVKERKLHILIYDLLSIVFAEDFPQNLQNRKFDQAKAARITKILK